MKNKNNILRRFRMLETKTHIDMMANNFIKFTELLNLPPHILTKVLRLKLYNAYLFGEAKAVVDPRFKIRNKKKILAKYELLLNQNAEEYIKLVEPFLINLKGVKKQ